MDALESRQLLSAENPVVPPPRLEVIPGLSHYGAPAGARVDIDGGAYVGSETTLHGTPEDDRIIVEAGPNPGEISVRGIAGIQDGTIIAGITQLRIFSGFGDDSVFVDPGVSLRTTIWGSQGDDTLTGGSGDDEFQALWGNDVIDGGGGFDTYKMDGVMGGRALLEQGLVPDDGFGGSDALANIERVLGMPAPRWMPGDASETTGGLMTTLFGSMTIWGTPGDDHITIRIGTFPDEVILFGVRGVPDGTVFSGIVSIEVRLGDGKDTLDANVGTLSRLVDGGAGDNEIIINGQVQAPTVLPQLPRSEEFPNDASEATGGLQNLPNTMSIWGTPDDDQITIRAGAAAGEVVVSGVRGVPDGTVFTGIEYIQVKLGDGNDTLYADFAGMTSIVEGGAGDDQIIITGKAQILRGGPGNDTIRGGAGQEYLDGGPGNDSLDGGGGGDILFVGIPADQVVSGLIVRFDRGTVPSDGYGGHDVIKNIEHLQGGTRFDDLIWGDDHDNTFIAGGGGDDSVFGGDGNDTFYVESPVHLLGGAGNDVYHTLQEHARLVEDIEGHNITHFDGFGLPRTESFFPSDNPSSSDKASGRTMTAAQRTKVAKLKRLKAAKAKAAKLKAARFQAAKLKALKLAARKAVAVERPALGGRGY